ncbi:MAG: hypothetical protein AB7G47_17230 [Mycolicibacterium sp.]|uniref:hypothetical protein n=1 Tax=Mycolicibacterium sp. TaxID=2320850 RepID=UPI003D0B2136
MTVPTEIRIAGVPWPVYKLVSLVLGGLAVMVVGAATGSAAAAVLTGAAVATVVWVALSSLHIAGR